MKKILLYAMVMTFAIFTACKNDSDDAKKLPVVSADAVSVAINDKVEVTFNYTAEAGFKSATVSPAEATITTDLTTEAGKTSGTIAVEYTAGTTVAAKTVSLTVTDNDDQQTTFGATVDVKAGISITGNISENTTWETGKVYILEGRIFIEDGVTLTIQPGVVVKGEAGVKENAKALIVARGGKLMAEGTATQPIIFTSVADNILPGQIQSPNLNPELDGLWGGLIVLGKAPISAKNDDETNQIEGIPPSDANGLYGGTVADDNSGTIRYISIRHGGTNIGEGNEINGLTLGGVGSGTTIDHVEVIANQDDGVEWFGGTVDVSDVLVWNNGDDAIDTDQAWSGTLDNAIIINPGDECFELDGPEGSGNGSHTIKNVSAKAHDAQGLADLDANSEVTMTNIFFFDVEDGQDFDLDPALLTASNHQIVLADGTVLADFYPQTMIDAAEVTAVTTATVGADKAEFTGWTLADAEGALADF